MPSAVRDRIPALGLVALLHLAAVIAFLNAVIIAPQPAGSAREGRETEITLSPPPPALQPRRAAPVRGGAPATTGTYFNPYTFKMAPAQQGAPAAIAMALSACDPGRYDMASAEIRRLCDRIGLALKNDPAHFGIVSDVGDPKHWQTELARREAPYLAPCMSPNGPDVIYALTCIYKILFGGYDSEHRPRYSD